MSTTRLGMHGGTAGSELAFAHPGASEIALSPPGWPARVLAIESPTAGALSGLNLLAHGFELHTFADGAGALLAMHGESPAVILAPTDMLGVDLLSFVDAVTAWTDIPIIIGLGAGPEAGELAFKCLERGARSIVGLPCTSEQMNSAIRACGVRSAPLAPPISVGPLTIEPQAFRATINGRVVILTPREFLIVKHLMLASPRIVGVEDLARAMSTYDEGSVGSTRVLITKIRKKFDNAQAGAGNLVHTIRAVGYSIDERLNQDMQARN